MFFSHGPETGWDLWFLLTLYCLSFQDCLLEGKADMEQTAPYALGLGILYSVHAVAVIDSDLSAHLGLWTHLPLSVLVNSLVLARCLPGLRNLPSFIFYRPILSQNHSEQNPSTT